MQSTKPASEDSIYERQDRNCDAGSAMQDCDAMSYDVYGLLVTAKITSEEWSSVYDELMQAIAESQRYIQEVSSKKQMSDLGTAARRDSAKKGETEPSKRRPLYIMDDEREEKQDLECCLDTCCGSTEHHSAICELPEEKDALAAEYSSLHLEAMDNECGRPSSSAAEYHEDRD
ncbi:unnamed protein product [Nippostrongylus brasiliensis]|uniref:Uncharacterized protein n=1 Tax=Nippostrongylus brasiliensis TaxID=27835 RepID=A0A0N4YNM9_NIPBR|nr:unnamed protein product [Nippostrongylus brasiliensis]